MRIKRYKKKYNVKGGSKVKGAKSPLTLLLLAFIFISNALISQSNVTTVGIQYKPIFSSSFAGGGTQTAFEGNNKMSLALKRGSSFGLIIRKGFTKSLSFETGINSVTRRFQLDFEDLDSTFNQSLDFKFTSYEIPVQGLIYIQLGERSFINTALGVSLNSYPGNVQSIRENFSQGTVRDKKFQFAIVGNVGYEYRTKESGYFYVGASFYNPFSSIAHTTGFYRPPTGDETIRIDINGNYLTLDLRYFFHERPEK